MRSRNLGTGYQGAVEAAVAVVVSIGIGIWVDDAFETSPVGLFTGLAIGLGAFIVRLLRLLQASSEDPKPEDPKED